MTKYLLCLVLFLPAMTRAATFAASPVTVQFTQFNPVLLNTFFSFHQQDDGTVALELTVETMLGHGGSDFRRTETNFHELTLKMVHGDRVYAVQDDGSTVLIAHSEGFFGSWKVDHASLEMNRQISYQQKSVTLSPTLTLP